MNAAIAGIWVVLGVFVATLVITVVGQRSADPKWQRRSRIAAIALVVEFVLIMVAVYFISQSTDSGWVF